MTERITDISFINKYKPLYFKDFEYNNKAIDIIQTLIVIDSVNVLLFGDTTTGKSSILNSIIREYYTGFSPKQYEDNVLYINSLKEQGINYYRTDVKTFCQTCSTIKGKKKIIILDDIDFINEQSQQVFRNFIDKYSHNVNFISSCSNNQKVIESLQSRLIIIKIKPLQKENIIRIINNIRVLENIDMDEESLNYMIKISNNNIKILINYMEKFKLINQAITLNVAIHLCSNINFTTFEEYTDFILKKQLHPAIKIITEIYEKGYSVMDILDNYFIFIKSTSSLTEDQKYIIIPYLCKYIAIFNIIHEDEIELALFTNNLCKMLNYPSN